MYRPVRLHRLAESIIGLLKNVYKFGLQVPVSELLDLCAVLTGDGLGEGVLVKLLHVLGQVVLGLFNGQSGHNLYCMYRRRILCTLYGAVDF
jgi:hypothetical protein